MSEQSGRCRVCRLARQRRIMKTPRLEPCSKSGKAPAEAKQLLTSALLARRAGLASVPFPRCKVARRCMPSALSCGACSRRSFVGRLSMELGPRPRAHALPERTRRRSEAVVTAAHRLVRAQSRHLLRRGIAQARHPTEAPVRQKHLLVVSTRHLCPLPVSCSGTAERTPTPPSLSGPIDEDDRFGAPAG